MRARSLLLGLLIILDVGEGDLRPMLRLVAQIERRTRHERRGAVEVGAALDDDRRQISKRLCSNGNWQALFGIEPDMKGGASL